MIDFFLEVSSGFERLHTSALKCLKLHQKRIFENQVILSPLKFC